MKIEVELSKVDIALGNNGINLKISDNQEKHVGDLRIGRPRGLDAGQDHRGECEKIPMKKFLAMLDAL